MRKLKELADSLEWSIMGIILFSFNVGMAVVLLVSQYNIVKISIENNVPIWFINGLYGFFLIVGIFIVVYYYNDIIRRASE